MLLAKTKTYNVTFQLATHYASHAYCNIHHKIQSVLKELLPQSIFLEKVTVDEEIPAFTTAEISLPYK
jgi:hypothetical protein